EEAGDVAVGEGLVDAGGEEGVLLVGEVEAGAAEEDVVAEVVDGEGDVAGLAGDAGAEAGAADADLRAPGGEAFEADLARVVAVDGAGGGELVEEGGDGVVGAEAGEVDDGGEDLVRVEAAGVAGVRGVADGLLEALEEGLLEVFADGVGDELDGAGGVEDDLDGLDAGEVVEEPAAARVHEHGVALGLQEPEGADLLVGVEGAA